MHQVSSKCCSNSPSPPSSDPPPMVLSTTFISVTHLLDYSCVEMPDTAMTFQVSRLRCWTKRNKEGEKLLHALNESHTTKLMDTKEQYSPNGSSILELSGVFTLTMSSFVSARQHVLNPLFSVSPYGVKCGSLTQGSVVWEGCCWWR